MAAAFAEHHCDTRQAGATVCAPGAKARPRSANAFWHEPELFLKTQRQATGKPGRHAAPSCSAIWRWWWRLCTAPAGGWPKPLPEMTGPQQQQPHGARSKARAGNSQRIDGTNLTGAETAC